MRTRPSFNRMLIINHIVDYMSSAGSPIPAAVFPACALSPSRAGDLQAGDADGRILSKPALRQNPPLNRNPAAARLNVPKNGIRGRTGHRGP